MGRKCRYRRQGHGWPQNVGNGLTHLLLSRAIRVTLRVPLCSRRVAGGT